MTGWTLTYDGFDPDQEGLREALCALSNGYMATRGAAPEAPANNVHYPGTYRAGLYNRLVSNVNGQVIENEALVNLPNWLPLTFRIDDGDWFDLSRVEILTYRQELDLKHGILHRALRFRDARGRQTSLISRRIVHLRHYHLAGLETSLTAENWSGRVTVRSALDGRVANTGVSEYRALNNQHLEPVSASALEPGSLWLKVRTSQSRIEIDMAARTRLFANDEPLSTAIHVIQEPAYVGHDFSLELQQGCQLKIEKIMALFTSRDAAISESGLAARQAVAHAGCFDDLLTTHKLAWEQLWRRCDIQFGEEEETAGVVRTHIFHLVQTLSPNTVDLDVGVPARGWHGEAYRGHIFWDELFILPFLSYQLPEVTRARLLYRYRRLGQAQWAAKMAGYRGAMYPWQSGSSGREETAPMYLNPRSGHWLTDNTELQRHIDAAIAFNIWHYYQVTGDSEFLCTHGAEMLLEIARFWASIATYNPALDRYEIHGVMGPDEFHDGYPWADRPGLSNNTYTNVMAVWVLCRALEVLACLPAERRQELLAILRIEHAELERWDAISRKMRIVFLDNGLLSQFEGYDQLAELDWEAYRQRYGNIQRMDLILEAEGDTANRYKLAKQADVMMLFYLFSADELRELFKRLGYPFDDQLIERTTHYYLVRSSRGSTLSRVVYAWVLARLDRQRSWRWFTAALSSDINDIQGGSTPEGIHLGAMGGSVDLLQRGYTGLEARGDALWFNPRLPEQLTSLSMRLYYRRCWLDVMVTQDCLRVRAQEDAPAPVTLCVHGQTECLNPGESREFRL